MSETDSALFRSRKLRASASGLLRESGLSFRSVAPFHRLAAFRRSWSDTPLERLWTGKSRLTCGKPGGQRVCHGQLRDRNDPLGHRLLRLPYHRRKVLKDTFVAIVWFVACCKGWSISLFSGKDTDSPHLQLLGLPSLCDLCYLCCE